MESSDFDSFNKVIVHLKSNQHILDEMFLAVDILNSEVDMFWKKIFCSRASTMRIR